MRTDRGWRMFYATGWLVSAFITAHAYRQWKSYVREVDARLDEVERTREETALRRAAEERLRIARDLHDSLTHSISVVKVQAGVAAHLARKRGEEVSPALLAIQEAGEDAARELRATLSVLRNDSDQHDSGLDQLSALVERTRGWGVSTTLQVVGDAHTVPTDVDHAAYRLVQEALANVGRHAPGASATVRLEYGNHSLTVQVLDDGPKLQHRPTPGHGLIGMRERVAALGGHLEAEPRPHGGFSIRADLPLAVQL